MRKTTLTRTTAAIFGATMLLGVAACADDGGDTDTDTTTTATTGTDAEGAETTETETETETTDDNAGDEGEDGQDGEDGAADVDTEDVEEGDVPQNITDLRDQLEADGMNLGAFQSAERAGDNFLVEYEEGWIASSEEGGPQPIIGKIAETWAEDGGLGNDVGMPTAPEVEIDNGWEQEFTNGKILWTAEDGGEFGATYE